MKKILFAFPLRYYLNPVSMLATAFMLFVEYIKWTNLWTQMAEFEKYNVKHSHHYFELIPSTTVTIIWIIFNILLYPYVFDAIVKLAVRIWGSVVTKGMIKNTISIYQAEMARGDIYTHHKIEYNAFGYPTDLVPQFDRAKSRALTSSSNYLSLRIGLMVVSIGILISLLWGGWMLSIVIGWFLAYSFHKEK